LRNWESGAGVLDKLFYFGRYHRPDVKERKRGKDEGAVRSSKNYKSLSILNWDFKKTDAENVTAILTKLHSSPLLAVMDES